MIGSYQQPSAAGSLVPNAMDEHGARNVGLKSQPRTRRVTNEPVRHEESVSKCPGGTVRVTRAGCADGSGCALSAWWVSPSGWAQARGGTVRVDATGVVAMWRVQQDPTRNPVSPGHRRKCGVHTWSDQRKPAPQCG
eukprot:4659758-Prymnesium_polylepis.2